MKNFLINFIAASGGVWFVFFVIWGWYIALAGYHLPVLFLFSVSFILAAFETIRESQ